MLTRVLGIAGLVLSVSVVACSGASPEDAASTDDNQEALSAAQQVKGAWTLTSDNTSITDIVLYGDHKLLRRNTARIMNGMVVNGGSFQREEGTWSISKSKHTITFHVNGNDDTMSYEYTPAPVLNGMFLPGHEPKAKLVLRGIPAPMSHIAFPDDVYESAASFCFNATDCSDELSADIWTPADNSGTPSCDTAKNTCTMSQGQACGNNVCGDGETCCNPLSGVCVKPGEVCAL